MKFENLLKEIGDEHRYQIIMIIIFLLPTSFFNAYFEGLFLFSKPDHWCRVPEFEHLPNEQQHQYIRPMIDGKLSSCHQYDYISYFNETIPIDENTKNISLLFDDIEIFNSMMANITNFTKTITCTYGWIYDKSLYSETASTWFNLVCNRDYYVNLILSLSSVGFAVMTPFLSFLSDSIGRRKALLLTMIIAAISCLSPLILKDIYSFLLARFLAGGVFSVFYQIPFVMVQEMTSKKWRTKASCTSAIFYALGAISVPVIVKLTGDWVKITLIQFIITLMFIFAYKWIPESPSWLISKGRFEEAHKQLIKISKFNKKPIPENLMQKIKSSKEDNNHDSFLDLFMKPRLRNKIFIITIVFIACFIGYNGINVNTANLEANNQLWSYFLLACTDIPALLIGWYLITTRLGRRWTEVGSLALCGICLMIPSLHPTYDETFYLVCTLAGKFGIAATFMIVFQHASELLPTTLRNQGIGVTATLGSLGNVLAPQIIYLNRYGEWIPLFIIGLFCLMSAIIASFLPETLNEYLPQRVQQAEEFGRDRPYWSLAKDEELDTDSDDDEDSEECVDLNQTLANDYQQNHNEINNNNNSLV